MVAINFETTTLKNFIDGKWVDCKERNYVPVLNPATGEKIARVPLSTHIEVEKAVSGAKMAQKKWALVPAPKRAEQLYRIGQLMTERKERLAQILTLENGKIYEESLGEVQEGIDMAFYMAGEGRRLFGQTTPSELEDKFAMSVRAPIGVIGIITPWNFPIAIAAWKAFPALIAGNAVIWKPSKETPLIANEMARIFTDAGLPKGIVNIIYGSGSTVGNSIVKHPDIRVISFTGSNEVGRDIASTCGQLLKKVSLEMGGKNAVIVMDDADLDLAVEGIIWSAFGTSGQRCTACSRVIVHERVKKKLEDRLKSEIPKLRIGNGLDPDVKMGPIINEAALEKIKSYIEIGIREGAKLIAGGYTLQSGEFSKGYYFVPTIFTDVSPSMRVAQEEIFGPVISIIPVKNFSEAIAVNNNVTFGLSSSIYTKDVNKVFQSQRDLDTGIIYINAGTTGAEIHLPFGGTKGTGNGYRDSGIAALDVFTEWKSIYIDFSGKLQRAQIDNHDRMKSE